MAKQNAEVQEYQIEDNMLVSWFEKKFGYLKPYYKTIGVVAGLLVVAAVLFMFLRKMQHDNYASQWGQFNLAYNNMAFQNRPSFMTEMGTQLGDLPASNWGYLIAADIELRNGLTEFPRDREAAIKKIKKAKQNYQKIVDSAASKTPMLEHKAVFGLGYSHESLGEFDEARKCFQQIVDQGEEGEMYEYATLGLQRVNDESLTSFYTEFRNKTAGAAPGVILPSTPDISFPEIDLGDDPVSGDQFKPKMEMEKPEMEKPEMEKPEMEKPEMEKPEMEKPEMEKPEMEKPEMEKPEMEKPSEDKK